MTEQQFIEAHVKVCSVRPKPRYYGLPHRKRNCARELWKYCQKLGIEPVLHHADLPKLIESKKGKADPTS